VAEIVKRHVTLTVEGSDRMYLNVYVPCLQYEHGINRSFAIIAVNRCHLRPCAGPHEKLAAVLDGAPVANEHAPTVPSMNGRHRSSSVRRI